MSKGRLSSILNRFVAEIGSELPVIGGIQADPRQLIHMAPGIREGVESEDFKIPPSVGRL